MTEVLVPHEDGRWWRATLLAQYRSTLEPGRWKVTVRYSVELGATYQRTLWADDCLPVDNPPLGWTDPRQDGGPPAPHVTPAGFVTQAPREEPPW
jgi:hypothetical protein